eukprot:m51a1_g8268 hypothetical protein (363) ;mRNA; f:49317-50461
MEADFAEQLALVEQALREDPANAELLSARASLAEIAAIRGQLAVLDRPPDMFSPDFDAAPAVSVARAAQPAENRRQTRSPAPAGAPRTAAPAPRFVSGGVEGAPGAPSEPSPNEPARPDPPRSAGGTDGSDGSEGSGESDESDEQSDESEGLYDPEADAEGPGELLAAWEAHTRGVGTRLMLAMGYRRGEGLGLRSDGVVEPLDAGRAPRRRRDAAAGIGHRSRARASEGAAREERESKRRRSGGAAAPTVFAFLNEKLGPKSPRAASAAAGAPAAGGARASDEELRRELCATRDRLRAARAAEERLARGYERNRGRDAPAARAIGAQLAEQSKCAAALEHQQRRLSAELERRSAKRKTTHF